VVGEPQTGGDWATWWLLDVCSHSRGDCADSRSLEELLSFIGDDNDEKKKRFDKSAQVLAAPAADFACRSKKRRNRRKGKGKAADSMGVVDGLHGDEGDQAGMSIQALFSFGIVLKTMQPQTQRV
jgi:hypothetical protein